jgi:hypothetical protein
MKVLRDTSTSSPSSNNLCSVTPTWSWAGPGFGNILISVVTVSNNALASATHSTSSQEGLTSTAPSTSHPVQILIDDYNVTGFDVEMSNRCDIARHSMVEWINTQASRLFYYTYIHFNV